MGDAACMQIGEGRKCATGEIANNRGSSASYLFPCTLDLRLDDLLDDLCLLNQECPDNAIVNKRIEESSIVG